jgi:hypothetical protein
VLQRLIRRRNDADYNKKAKPLSGLIDQQYRIKFKCYTALDASHPLTVRTYTGVDGYKFSLQTLSVLSTKLLYHASRSFSALDFCTSVLAQLQKPATRRAKKLTIFKPVSMCFISFSFLTPLNHCPCHSLRKFISSCCQTNYGFPATKLIRTKC